MPALMLLLFAIERRNERRMRELLGTGGGAGQRGKHGRAAHRRGERGERRLGRGELGEESTQLCVEVERIERVGDERLGVERLANVCHVTFGEHVRSARSFVQ